MKYRKDNSISFQICYKSLTELQYFLTLDQLFWKKHFCSFILKEKEVYCESRPTSCLPASVGLKPLQGSVCTPTDIQSVLLSLLTSTPVVMLAGYVNGPIHGPCEATGTLTHARTHANGG